MTPTADLVKELRDKALRDCVGQQVIAEKTAEWQAAVALEATQARADKLEEELATLREVANHNYEVSQKHLARAESAESRAAAMRDALESVNKLIEWERRNGTHFALLDHEIEYVSGLWFDARNAVITALKTAAGKEIPRRQLFADMEEAWVNQKHYWRCKGCPDCQGIK